MEFSSKAFIMRPLQRMLSTHWKRRGWEVGGGGGGGEDGPAARQAWTPHERAPAWAYPGKTPPFRLRLPRTARDWGGRELLPENRSFAIAPLHPSSGGSIAPSCSPQGTCPGLRLRWQTPRHRQSCQKPPLAPCRRNEPPLPARAAAALGGRPREQRRDRSLRCRLTSEGSAGQERGLETPARAGLAPAPAPAQSGTRSCRLPARGRSQLRHTALLGERCSARGYRQGHGKAETPGGNPCLTNNFLFSTWVKISSKSFA